MATIRGEQTTLRPLVQEDLPLLHRWLNDPEVMRWWEGRDHPASFDRVEARFRRSIDGSDRELHRYMIETLGAEPRTIGLVQHGRIPPRVRNVQIDVLIGESDCRDSGYGTDALRAFLAHLFGDLRVHRVWHWIRAGNEGALRSAEKLGFVREGLLREHDWLEGRYVDVAIYGLLASEWRR
jgi:RimJ/RimL family protein N-acetyltransferase